MHTRGCESTCRWPSCWPSRRCSSSPGASWSGSTTARSPPQESPASLPWRWSTRRPPPYLKCFGILPAEGTGVHQTHHLGDPLQMPTYLQCHETLRPQATRDALTAVRNRGSSTNVCRRNTRPGGVTFGDCRRYGALLPSGWSGQHFSAAGRIPATRVVAARRRTHQHYRVGLHLTTGDGCKSSTAC